MKKLLAVMSLALGLGFASAQQVQHSVSTSAHPAHVKQTTTTSVKKTDGKTAVIQTKTTKTTAPKTAVAKPVAPGVHLKADGTPDKRYKQQSGTTHLKKDGTPDKRYKENKR